ncbi:MAG: PASTA domain-containing protein [Chitinophagaceae bacterium]|nr:PASTA domain-containing protein [Chitinophagaceae bacterium]
MSSFKEKMKTSFGMNVAMVFVVFVLLYIMFFASLHCVTRHGEELAMPDVRGVKIDSAINKLKTLGFDVLIDSTFDPTSRPLSVLKQVPDTGSLVKKGRTIFLTVNMLTPPAVPMPNVKDLSYRSAAMILRNNKLLVGDTTYKPDIASGAILSASYKGQPINPGDPVPQGSKIDLVIGNGLGNTEWNVPNVTGLTVDEAIIILNQFNLQPLLVAADQMSEISDTPSARIIDQSPREFNEAGEHNRIQMGAFIDLQIMQNPREEDIHYSTGNTNAGTDVSDYNPKKKK